jgi:tRNA pseudouridine38-40 synthase
LPTFKITVAYDGTDYVGWQRQAEGASIQMLLEDAFEQLDGRPVAVVGAGRTDAGVHALAQVASVALARSIDSRSLVPAINVRLPATVRVLEAVEVTADFHARFRARAKSYRYRIWNAEVASPFERLYAWHIPGPQLDEHAMALAARAVEGHHDFAAFQGTGGETRSTERTVYASSVVRTGPLVTYDIRGDGFLRHMVRNLVGTLVEIGRGKQQVAWMADVLASRDRAVAGRTAPPEGLFLVRVDYDDEAVARPE